MSKAEVKSKQYRDFREQCGIKDPVMLNEIEEAYYEGYNQAEKDNELTWDDMHAIAIIEDRLIHEQCLNDQTLPTTQEFYEEVLKRFKTKREESC